MQISLLTFYQNLPGEKGPNIAPNIIPERSQLLQVRFFYLFIYPFVFHSTDHDHPTVDHSTVDHSTVYPVRPFIQPFVTL